ncbi:polysaccharide biosynthesis C-terminal domain-containing protein, partial [Flavobacteriaceae bacterium]|nr:polysaccharide biosynthesis C-terminal domain-containing protein [Flavobacteriaceae bacterium]
TKLFSASTGCLNNIITNSKYFYVVPIFSIGSAIAVVFLNIYFIEKLGFIGAAVATLIVISIFNALKLLFVARTFKISPYGKETLYLLGIIGGTYLLFLCVSLPFTAFLNLGIKCTAICLLYLVICYQLKLSNTVNEFLETFFKKLRSIF